MTHRTHEADIGAAFTPRDEMDAEARYLLIEVASINRSYARFTSEQAVDLRECRDLIDEMLLRAEQ